MTDWQSACLTAMAISLVIMALIQVGVIAGAVWAGLKAKAALDGVQKQIRPIMVKVEQIADQAVKTSGLVSAQAERLDALVTAQSDRLDRMVTTQTDRIDRLVTTQTDRVDELVSTLTERIDETADVLQQAVFEPVRRGTAMMAGVRAAFASLRQWRSRDRPSPSIREEEDPMFVG